MNISLELECNIGSNAQFESDWNSKRESSTGQTSNKVRLEGKLSW